MTIIFCESFDAIDLGHMNGGTWTVFDTALDVSTTAGRNGKGTRSTSGTKTFRQALASADQDDVIVVGAAMKMDALAAVTLQTWKGDTNTTTHLTWKTDINGALLVERAGTQLAITANSVIIPEVWHYVEFRGVLANTGGQVEIRVDGKKKVSTANLDTANGGTTLKWTDVEFSCGATGKPSWDDIYILNGLGTKYTGPLGNIRVEALLPTSHDTNNSQPWDGSDGNTTDNHLLVDDSASGDPWDTDYVQHGGDATKDLYGFNDLASTTGTVYAVQVWARAKQDIAGTKKLALLARESAGTEAESAKNTLSTSYAWYNKVFETKPAGDAWSISQANKAVFGPKGYNS